MADEDTTKPGDEPGVATAGVEERDTLDRDDFDEDDDLDRPRRMGAAFGAAPVVVWVTVLLLALMTYGVLKIAGEQHYQSCVAGVSARTEGATDALSRFARLRGVQRCSHSPF